MEIRQDKALIAVGVILTAFIGFLIEPNMGLIIGLLSSIASLALIIKNKRKYLDERALEILKTSSLQTLTVVATGSLILSLGIWSMYYTGQIEEPNWFWQYSVQTATILAVFAGATAIEMYRKGEILSEIA